MTASYGTHPKQFTPGERVALHPSTSAWVSGMRYATVVTTGYKYVHLRLDSGRLYPVRPWMVRKVESMCSCREEWDWMCRVHGMND